jgi:phage shock protein B
MKSIKQRDSSLNEDDARTLQELHKVVTLMESRVEALETILIERSRDDEFARKL